ncbi:hypothetical protein MASR1M90_06940 [Desulfovibrionales bacterium]
MDVSIIYVNWNSAEEIAASIASIKARVRDVDYEIIVVDNNSAQSCAPLEQQDVKLVRNPINAGFGSGCNLGVTHSSGRYLLFLNPDTRLLSDILSCLAHFLDKTPKAGACGPMVVREDNSIDFGAARADLTLVNEFLEHSTLAFRFPKNRFLGRPYYSFWDHNTTRPVDSLLGACMLFRREIFERLGGFDENFFLYAEEVDLCRRTREAGYDIYYVHTCHVLHKSKHSTTQFFGGMHTMILQYLVSLNYYFKKHYGLAGMLAWRAVIFFVYTTRAVLGLRRGFLDYSLWSLGLRTYQEKREWPDPSPAQKNR